MSLRARLGFVISSAAVLLCSAGSAQTLSSLTVSPTKVTLGSNAVGTVTLSGAAPAGGKVVTLTSSVTSAATVPTNVTVLQGSTSATFTVTALSVTANKTPSIKATLGTTSKSVTVTVLPLFASFTLNQASAVGGTVNPTGTITLNGPAPSGGASVSLTSSATSRATVPASVTVPAGTTLLTFSATTLASAGSATITAGSGGVTKTAALTVTTSPVPLSVSFAQASIRGGQTTTGTVTLNGPATGTGAVVSLTSSKTTIATVPASVTVPAGATSAGFTATGISNANGSATITAALNGTSKTATLAVTPNPALLSVTFPVGSIKAGNTATGTVFLNAPATASSTVTLASSSTTTLTVPASVTIPSGASSATFTATAAASPSAASATVTASYSSVNKTAVLGVTTAPVLLSVSLAPTTVLGGAASTGTVNLNANAASATTVTLYSSNAAVATVPSSVTIPSGASSAAFTVASLPVGASTNVFVAAVSSGVTASTPLTVTSALPSAISLDPSSVASGGTSTGTVTLTGAAPSGGTVVSLASSSTSVASVPASITVAAGATSATFTVTALAVASTSSVAITATKNGVSASGTLTVNSLPPALSSVSVSPTTVSGGTSSAGTVSLTTAAGSGGVVVTLSSGSTAATVPAYVTVAQGATTATFTAATVPVGVATTATITASYSGVSRTATLTVTPAALTSLALAPTSVRSGTGSTGTVTLGSAAPAGGLSVALSSSNTNAATVPAGVVVPEAATSATFPVTSLGVGSSTSVTITASVPGSTKTASLTVTPAALSSLTLAPSTVPGGTASIGTVTLNGLAPLAGTVVGLSSSRTSAATVPASVTVPSGASSATFSATALSVSSNTSSTISASYSGTTKTATLSVQVAGTVTATVTNAATNALLQGAIATVQETGATATTDSSGIFTIRLAPGTFTLMVNGPPSPPFFGGAISATVVANQTTDLGTIPLTPLGTVTGNVTDQATGAPLGGVSVSPYAYTSPDTTTDAQGHFTDTAPAGPVTVYFDKPGYVRTTAGPFTLAQGQVLDTGTTPMRQGGTVTGKVVDSQTLAAIASALVTETGGTNTISTDGTGSFSMTVTPGSVTITVSQSTYQTATVGSLVVTAGQTIDAGTIPLTQIPLSVASLTLLNSSRESGFPVYGTVRIDRPAPSGGVILDLAIDGPASFTNSSSVTVTAGATSGPFSIYGDPVTEATPAVVSASLGGVTKSATLTVLPAGLQSVSLPAAFFGGSEMVGTLSFHGNTVQPVPVTFACDAPQILAVPDGVDQGSYQNTGFSTTFNFRTVSQQVAADTPVTLSVTYLGQTQPAPVTLQAPPAGMVVGQVLSVDYGKRSALAGATITEDGTSNSATTGSDGVFGLTPTAATFTATITAPGRYPTPTGPLTIPPDRGLFVGPLVLPHAVTVSGTVKNSQDNTVIAGATIAIDGLNLSTTSAANGYFVISPPEGSRTFLVSAPGFIPAQRTINLVAGVIYLGQNFFLDPPNSVALASFTAYPTLVASQDTSTLRIHLTKNAPSVGARVYLTSSNPSVISVPSTFIVLGGYRDANYDARTYVNLAETTTVTITATCGGVTQSVTLTITPPPPRFEGVSPAYVLPGDTNVVAWGYSFRSDDVLRIRGPVYTLYDTSYPLCPLDYTVPGCPTVSPAVSASANGRASAFAVPAGLAPGYYQVLFQNAYGMAAQGAGWLQVEEVARAFPAQLPDEHQVAERIQSGQTVTGTFAENGDPSGTLGDFNYYYFVATAGTRVSATLERVDTSVPWENPASLDPQLEIVAPDGFIYANLARYDNSPGVDLNATLSGAVLPQTGVYLLAAETTRGSGAYRLRFTIDSMAPPPAGSRVVPLSDTQTMVQVGGAIKPAAVMLDPRGYPVSGAQASFAVVFDTGDHGAVQFVGNATITTSPDGTASTTANVTAAGKVRFAPRLHSSILVQSLLEPLAGAPEPLVPIFEPIGRRAFAVRGMEGETLSLDGGSITRFPAPLARTRVEVPGAPGGKSPLAEIPPTPARRSSATREAVPLGYVPLVITTCDSSGTFSTAGVDVPVKPPFTFTLTDKTPSTGKTEPNGEVDADGIHGHRIEKTIRLKLDVKDATGSAPDYPVLVVMALGGPKHGTLILDPDGVKVECDKAAFLWHERDEQGNIVALNEEFEYKLGTYSSFVGVKPDPAASGDVLPVWAETENLVVRVTAFNGKAFAEPFQQDFPVHPEPGKPDHFVAYDIRGRLTQASQATQSYWADYLKYINGTKGDGSTRYVVNPFYLFNSWFLNDKYENTTFGYTSTSATPPASNVTVTFKDQTKTGPDPSGYLLMTSWNDDPVMPTGPLSSTLAVSYSGDPDWGSGSVNVVQGYTFDSGSFHFLVHGQGYEKPFSVDDGTLPLSVSPGATGAALPQTTAKDARRMVLLALTGTKYSGVLTRPEPYPDPHQKWTRGDQGQWIQFGQETGIDPKLETQDQPRFRLTLVDDNHKVVTDGGFRVHTCPRFDHEGPPDPTATNLMRPCSDKVQDSAQGVIANLQLNATGPNDARGYLGIELLTAPVNPGVYYIYVESLDATYRIRRQCEYTNDYSDAGEFKGAFALCNVGGLEFLDENYQRFTTSAFVDQSTPAYLRYAGSSLATSPLTVQVASDTASGTIFTELLPVTLSPVGVSGTWIGPLTLEPAAATQSAKRAAQIAGPIVRLPSGWGVVKALLPGSSRENPDARLRSQCPIPATIDTVGFTGDLKLTRWDPDPLKRTPIDPGDTDPTWMRSRTAAENDKDSVAYVKQALPTLFATLKIDPPMTDLVTATVLVKVDGVIQGVKQNVPVTGSRIDLRDLQLLTSLSDRVAKTEHTFEWLLSLDSGNHAFPLGVSGVHTIYSVEGTPVLPAFDVDSPTDSPLYDEALKMACEAPARFPAASDLETAIAMAVKTDVRYNDAQGNPLHPLQAPDVPSGVQCTDHADLMKGLSRSIGIDAWTIYLVSGANSKAYRYVFRSNDQVTFQAELPAEDEIVGANPHFNFHALVGVSTSSSLFDAVYGRAGTPHFLEVINPNTLTFVSGEAFAIFARTNFPAERSVYTGQSCLH